MQRSWRRSVFSAAILAALMAAAPVAAPAAYADGIERAKPRQKAPPRTRAKAPPIVRQAEPVPAAPPPVVPAGPQEVSLDAAFFQGGGGVGVDITGGAACGCGGTRLIHTAGPISHHARGFAASGVLRRGGM